MSRRTRFILYLVGICVAATVILARELEPAFDKLAIERVQYLAQERQEFKNRWLGVGVIQYPSDLITYATLLYRVKPEVVIETGTNYGGLSVFFATVMENINPSAKIVTVDIDSSKWDQEVATGRITPKMLERIVFVKGDSVSTAVLDRIQGLTQGKRGLVLLDSLHTKEHVLKELKLYSPFVSPGSYIIVNDTHLEMMKFMDTGSGPLRAVQDFLKENKEFAIDPDLPGTLLSCAPSGFLRRIDKN
jgi:cephalosporin hydroxylase